MNRNNRVILFSAGILVGLIASALWVYTFYGLPNRGASGVSSPASASETKETGAIAADTQKVNETPHTEGKEDFLPPVIVHEPFIYDEQEEGVVYTGKSDTQDITADNRNEWEENTASTESYENGQIVRKEVLLGVSSLKVNRKTTLKEPGKIDSLLDESNQVKRDLPVLSYQIEFWQSPLNSRGYRAGKNKLALFGIAPESQLALYELEEGLFLKTEKEAYRIEKTSEFRPFKAVTDKLILNQLIP